MDFDQILHVLWYWQDLGRDCDMPLLVYLLLSYCPCLTLEFRFCLVSFLSSENRDIALFYLQYFAWELMIKHNMYFSGKLCVSSKDNTKLNDWRNIHVFCILGRKGRLKHRCPLICYFVFLIIEMQDCILCGDVKLDSNHVTHGCMTLVFKNVFLLFFERLNSQLMWFVIPLTAGCIYPKMFHISVFNTSGAPVGWTKLFRKVKLVKLFLVVSGTLNPDTNSFVQVKF